MLACRGQCIVYLQWMKRYRLIRTNMEKDLRRLEEKFLPRDRKRYRGMCPAAAAAVRSSCDDRLTRSSPEMSTGARKTSSSLSRGVV